jgi:hypothetical protein
MFEIGARDLENIQGWIARDLEPLGQVVCSVVCRTAYKVVVRHRTGVSVRLLICSDDVKGLPFIYIMPILDPTERALYDEVRTFRGILPDGSTLGPVLLQAKTTLDAAVSAFESATENERAEGSL